MKAYVPTVSVVIPTWNAELWIKETLESVYAQTWTQLEIIVVDDGSSDATAKIVSAFVPRVTLIEQANAGNSVARNRGISESTGEFIALLDNDDLWLPQKIERQMHIMEREPSVGLVFCDYEAFGAGATPNGLARGPVLQTLKAEVCSDHGIKIVDPSAASRLLDDLYCQIPSTWLLRRTALEATGGFHPRLRNGGEDLNLAFRIALNHGLAYDKRVLMLRREHAASLGRTSNLDVSYVQALALLAEEASLDIESRKTIGARTALSSYYVADSLPPTDSAVAAMRQISLRFAHYLPWRQAIKVRLKAAAGVLRKNSTGWSR